MFVPFSCAIHIECENEKWVAASSLLDLIEWIYLQYPKDALKILREKIIFRKEPTVFDQALIKVAAKRYEVREIPLRAERIGQDKVRNMRLRHSRVSQERFVSRISQSFSDLSAAALWVQNEVAELRVELKSVEQLYERDRAVIAAAFNEKWQLLGAARNTNSEIRTRHAEMNLIEILKSSGLGHTAYFIVSLQSCRMCAALLASVLESHCPKAEVYYLEKEPALTNVATALAGVEKHFLKTREKREV